MSRHAPRRRRRRGRDDRLSTTGSPDGARCFDGATRSGREPRAAVRWTTTSRT